MHAATAHLLNSFKASLATYARNYYRLHGKTPGPEPTINIVKASLDRISDPAVRAKLRAAVHIRKLYVDAKVCQLEYGIDKRYIKFFDKYLS